MSQKQVRYYDEKDVNDDDEDDKTFVPLKSSDPSISASPSVSKAKSKEKSILSTSFELRHRIFIFAYITVAITIIGILLCLIGALLIIFKYVRFATSWKSRKDIPDSEYHFLGKSLSKYGGFICLGIGIVLAIGGCLAYNWSLKQIDKLIDGIQRKLSKRTENPYEVVE